MQPFFVVVCFDFAFSLSPAWRSVVGAIFSSEERKKKLPHNVIHACATDVGLGHDVTF